MGPEYLGAPPVNLFVLILVFGFAQLVVRLAFSQRPNPEQPQLKASPEAGAGCVFVLQSFSVLSILVKAIPLL